MKQQTVCGCEVVWCSKLNVAYAMAFIMYEHAVQPSIAMCGLMMVGVLQFLEMNSEYLHPFSMLPAFQVRKRFENLWFYFI